MKTRTIREFGGEIWAELDRVKGISVHDMHQTIDIIMGVLARYENTTIVNDEDLPVAPLPKKTAEDRH